MATTTSRSTESLPPHLRESGTPTRKEIDLAQAWQQAAFGMVAPAEGVFQDHGLDCTLPFRFRYGDQDSDGLMSAWPRQTREFGSDPGPERCEVTWTDHDTGLKVAAEIRTFNDFPAIEWLLIFQNTASADSLLLEDIDFLRLRLRRSTQDQSFQVHALHGTNNVADDYCPFTHSLPSADGRSELRIGSEGRVASSYPPPDRPGWIELSGRDLYEPYALLSGHPHLPFFNVETPDRRGAIVGLGWSGPWQSRFVVEGEGLGVRALRPKLSVRLRPGEQVRGLRVLVLFWQGECLHGHNMWRRLLERHYVPRLTREPSRPRVSVNIAFTHHGYGGFFQKVGAADIQPLIDPFVKMRIEFMVIDAMWWPWQSGKENFGSWALDPARYPHGIKTLVEPLARAGIPLGLWFAPERAGPDSLLAQQPDWIDTDVEANNGRLRMERRETRDALLSLIDRLIEHEGMGGYRQDYWAFLNGGPEGRQGMLETQHLTGLYAFWDELRRRHPGLVMEGCGGGGQRVDLETLTRFHWHQKSDRWYDSESDQCGLYGANLFLPGGLINVPIQALDDYGCWSAFAGQLCLGWNPTDWDFSFDRAARQVRLYKAVRPFLAGDFYPLTPCGLDQEWLGYQFHREDLDAGFALLFRRRPPDWKYPYVAGRFTLKLRGLTPDCLYKVQLERASRGVVDTGAALAEPGLAMTLPDCPAVELIRYERQILSGSRT